MKLKIMMVGVLLTSLVVLNGCNCACTGKKTCPLPEKVATTQEVGRTIQQ